MKNKTGVRLFYGIVFILVVKPSRAQNNEQNPYLNSWFTYLSQLKIDSEWSMSMELHERTGDFFKDQGQILIRPSIDYHIQPNASFSLGYTWINVQPFEPINQPIAFNENNLWEQALFKYQIKNVKFQNRIRFEHRWIQRIDENNTPIRINGTHYKNRFRYRHTMQFDISKLKNKPIFLHCFDEIWINQDDWLKPRSLNRNWFYAGIGIQLNESANAQIGYLNQIDRNGDKNLNTDIVQFTWVKNFNL